MSLSAPSSPHLHSASVALRRYSSVLKQINIDSFAPNQLSLIQNSAIYHTLPKSKPKKMSDGTLDLTGVLLGGFELGGTTVRVCLAQGHVTNVIFQESYPTEKPEITLKKAVDFFRKHPISSLGISSFGPIDLNPHSETYGYITTTPKPHWSNVNVVGVFKKAFPHIPIGWETDVNAVALAEIKWGNHHRKLENCCYITVGTGIGGGVVVNRQAINGALHPEVGHIRVRRHPDDTYKGNCPFHGDCLEGLANAKAIADRLELHPSQLHTVSDDHKVWDIEAFYLAQLCAAFAYIVSPQIIVIGGGVLKRTTLYKKIRQSFLEQLNEYLRVKEMSPENIDNYIVASRFDEKNSVTSAGCVGALELSRLVFERAVQAM